MEKISAINTNVNFHIADMISEYLRSRLLIMKGRNELSGYSGRTARKIFDDDKYADIVEVRGDMQLKQSLNMDVSTIMYSDRDIDEIVSLVHNYIENYGVVPGEYPQDFHEFTRDIILNLEKLVYLSGEETERVDIQYKLSIIKKWILLAIADRPLGIDPLIAGVISVREHGIKITDEHNNVQTIKYNTDEKPRVIRPVDSDLNSQTGAKI